MKGTPMPGRWYRTIHGSWVVVVSPKVWHFRRYTAHIDEWLVPDAIQRSFLHTAMVPKAVKNPPRKVLVEYMKWLVKQ